MLMPKMCKIVFELLENFSIPSFSKTILNLLAVIDRAYQENYFYTNMTLMSSIYWDYSS